ncbi:OLC1v1016548C1 [Oldenlandia corymbosa var. corymbosa]|uniref:OLC1v1016548C1 n=1 Tax=Oldenlandia corymbosa var. corymbosa TaxID=529605 RepID=A0AAV1E741_OLDCO|nr:OLC1v1016548C1 [Oldenlandia corymbosa var. corymbosa]
MKMTQVNMGGVPFETRSSQPINVPEYSEDDLKEENEDEENEFDEDDVQGISTSSRPRPSRASHASPPLIDPVIPRRGPVSTGVFTRPPPLIDPVCPRGGPVSTGVSTRPPPLIDPECPRRGPGFTGVSTRPVTTIASSGGSSQSRVSDEIDPAIWLMTDEVPGGPKDGSVIPSFLGHIAYHLWHGYHRPILKIFKGEKILNKLKLWYRNMDDVVKGKIRGTGLGHLLHTSYDDIDLGLGGRVTRTGNDRPRVHDWIPPSYAGLTSVPDRLLQVRERLDRFTELEWMNELRKITRDLIKKVKVSDRDLAAEYDEKLQDTMVRYYKAP